MSGLHSNRKEIYLRSKYKLGNESRKNLWFSQTFYFEASLQMKIVVIDKRRSPGTKGAHNPLIFHNLLVKCPSAGLQSSPFCKWGWPWMHLAPTFWISPKSMIQVQPINEISQKSINLTNEMESWDHKMNV